LIRGRYEVIGPNVIRVTELPIGFWTDDFKEHLESIIENANAKSEKEKPEKEKEGDDKGKTKTAGAKSKAKPKKSEVIIKDYSDLSTDVSVDITITFANGVLPGLLAQTDDNGCNAMEKLLKLYTTQTTTNMHAFDSKEKLRKYDSAEEIVEDFYPVRYEYYEKRKEYQLNELEMELKLLSNKAKYIKEILNDTIDLRKKKKEVIIQILTDKGYDVIDDDVEYKYLIKMPMDSVCEENVAKLLKEHGDKTLELETLKSKQIHTIWLEELDAILAYKGENDGSTEVIPKKTAIKKKIETKNKKINKKFTVVEDE
jgi:DNA topoisomerase-2